MVERIVFDAVLFCCGDILRKGVELSFQRSAMLDEDIEQRCQGGITEFSAYRFRRSRIVHIEPNLILPRSASPLCSQCASRTVRRVRLGRGDYGTGTN